VNRDELVGIQRSVVVDEKPANDAGISGVLTAV
jgi:hypothetical protein